MIQAKWIIVIGIRYFKNSFAVFSKTYPYISKVVSVLVKYKGFPRLK